MSLNSIRYYYPGKAEEDKAEHPVQKEHAVNCPNLGQEDRVDRSPQMDFSERATKILATLS